VQVGLQQRSGTHFQRAVQIVQNGEIGKVHYIECFNHTATAGGGPAIPPDSGVPQGLDWDFWLGPAPKVAYSAARQRSWRGFFDYGSGGLGDWGVHVMDIALWAMNAGAPQSISCMGARYLTQDPNDFSRSDTPDTVVVLYEFPGFVLHYSNIRHNSFGPNGNPGAKPFGAYGTMFHGTLGTLFVDRAGLEVVPQLIGKSDPNGKQYPRLTDDESAVNMFYTGLRGAERGSTSVQHYPHVRNFLDCVKSRKKPIADIEAAHLSTSICHLANVSYKTGEKLVWDGKNEKITNNSKANELLTRTYRAPWRLQGLA